MPEPHSEGSVASSSRVPPHSREAEESVLGAVLISRDALNEVMDRLHSDDFYIPAHAAIFEAMRILFDQGQPADPVGLTEVLRRNGELEKVGGRSYLTRLADYVPTASNVTYYATIVEENARRRDLIRAGSTITDLAFSAEPELHEVLDRAEQTVLGVAERRSNQNLLEIGPLFDDVIEQIEHMEQVGTGMTGLSTGFRDLDEKLAGLQPSNLVVIAARPAMGKSAFTTNIATNVALTGEPVAIFSLEMSKEEIVQRILASVGRVDSMKLRSGQLGPTGWQKVIKAASELFRTPVFIDDSPVVTVTDIRAKSRRLKRSKGLGLVVVDYLQLMHASGRENRQQEIAEISRNLKNLARELEVPVIAVSQLNRSLESREDKRPRLSDLRESGCLTAETRLVRADTNAEVTLGELAAAGERNVPVWTLDERFRLIRGNLTHAFPSGVKPVFDLRMASGRVVRASANHPFLTLDGWKPLEDLSEGSRIAVARNVPAQEETLHGKSANPNNDTIPPEVWEYVREKAMPAAGVSARELARRIGMQYCGSSLYKSGLSRSRAMRVADALDDAYLRDLATSEVLWDKIVTIEPVGETEVFDASVEGTHNFLANGIIAHNSIEQDADVVMFIYRHEQYDEADLEAKGIAEVHLAKHRAGSTGTVRMTFLPEFTRFADIGRDLS